MQQRRATAFFLEVLIGVAVIVVLSFHFGGHFEGRDLRSKYPEGADPYILGEAANTAMTYGYDSVTQMQETKCSLCRISKA